MIVEAGERIGAFLAETLPAGPWKLQQLETGGNNRTFQVQRGGERYVLKEYFRHPGDQRDRAAAEFAFARFAWQHGLRCLPEPLACDRAAGIGLFTRFVTAFMTFPQIIGTHGRVDSTSSLVLGGFDWVTATIVISAVTMTIGNLGAMFQTSMKRLLALALFAPGLAAAQPSDTPPQPAADKTLGVGYKLGVKADA